MRLHHSMVFLSLSFKTSKLYSDQLVAFCSSFFRRGHCRMLCKGYDSSPISCSLCLCSEICKEMDVATSLHLHGLSAQNCFLFCHFLHSKMSEGRDGFLSLETHTLVMCVLYIFNLRGSNLLSFSYLIQSFPLFYGRRPIINKLEAYSLPY